MSGTVTPRLPGDEWGLLLDRSKLVGFTFDGTLCHGYQGDVIASALEVETVGIDIDGDMMTSCVVVPAEPHSPAARRSLSGQAKVALDLLHRAAADAGESGTNSHVPPGIKTVSVELWKKYCYDGTVTDSDDPNSKRKAFNRAVKTLQAINAIGVWKDRVWVATKANGTCGTMRDMS
jgi:hypothetical protein